MDAKNANYPRTVHEGGYEIVMATRTDGRFPWNDNRFIVPKDEGFIAARQLAERTRQYDPMTPDYSASYFDFTNLVGADESAITNFVNRHGRLTSPEHWVQVQTDDENRRPVMAEPLTTWTVEARRLKLALDLLSAGKRG